MERSPVSAPDVIVRTVEPGVVYVTDRRTLGTYPDRITAWLDDWAERAPDRPFLLERDAAGAWASVTYAEARRRVRALTQALLDRRLSPERPLVILSGNSISHGLLALGAMYGGIPYAPVSPAYSLQSRDLATLSRIEATMRPGLVFAADGAAFDRAFGVFGADVEIVTSTATGLSRPATPFSELSLTKESPEVDDAHRAVGPDTVAKILFTSGSTGHPKGVINTQRMLCSNQSMLRAVFPFLSDEPPILCDWLPWHHTAGGNHNFGIALSNGGTFYLDGGRPTPEGIDTTVNNLREVAASAHFTVPRTYEALLPYLKADGALRSRFFSRLKCFFYAAAGLSQRHLDELQSLALETTGRHLLWVTGFGSTETAPFVMSSGSAGAHAGFVGFPVPGVALKLAAVGDKLEARVRGPNDTPGYWRDPTLSQAVLDEEGFYRMGDALRPVDTGDLSRGLMFDGRLTEDFKLSSGTWVSVGTLRARVLLHLAPYVRDVVIAAPDRPFVTALLFPDIAACRQRCDDLQPDALAAAVLAHPRVHETFRHLLIRLAADSRGSATRIARALPVDVPPSIDLGEVTDKGSLNQKAMLQSRAALVEELYAAAPSHRTIVV
jgi:feruloyl-CoA synthase